MKINKTKKGFMLVDSGLSIRFNSYEYSPILKDVFLYQNNVLVAIYSNREKFEEQLRGAKGNEHKSTPLAYPHFTRRLKQMHNNTTYIATISGGKDSVTMCDLLLKHGHPVDYIVFNDTLDEFEEMYTYLNKVEAYFKRKYNKEITRLNPHKSYDDYIFNVKKSGNNIGLVSGLPNPTQGFCEWRGYAKRDPLTRFAKQFENYRIYVGYTTSEPHRANRENEKLIYPLIDTFRMSEEDCQQYLISNDMENPLYRHFNRTGCRKCHYQSDRDFFNIWKHYPSVWREFVEYEAKVNALPNAIGKHWFKNFRSCSDMEKEFKASDTQGSLFDFSDEPLKDCFCKV